MKDYGGGYEHLDRDHGHLIEILKELQDLKGAPPRQLNELMTRFRAYLDAHLEHEEELMERFHYSETATHKANHADFRRKADVLAAAIAADAPSATSKCVVALQEWIETHMCGSDRHLAEYLATQDKTLANPECGVF